MPTFADLLTSYMARTGIGDAEFARRLGVSRLTLIRWKEGVTLRPRYRDDVLRCADLLRLGAGERDSLLLAAGFAPEITPLPAEEAGPIPEAPGTEEPDDYCPRLSPSLPRTETAVLSGGAHPRRAARIAGAAALALVVILGVGTGVVLLLQGPAYPKAAQGESLIIMAPFANYTSGQQGFNVRGRLKEEIDQEVRLAGLSGVRTAEWPQSIASADDASDAGNRSGAAMVIWGEYDSGRVVASFNIPQSRTESHQQLIVDLDSSPSDLPTTINLDLPDEVRSMALMTLGQLFLEGGEHDLAKTVLIRALARPPIDPSALASLRYRLGHAFTGGEFADLDEAIWLFTQVLAAKPRSGDAYSSRGIAYLERGRNGDADLAIHDLTQAVSINPRDSGAYVNRAVAHMERNRPTDLSIARNGLTHAIELEPDSPIAYFNRGLVYSVLENWDQSTKDLLRAQELRPDDPKFNETLCWQLGLQRQPEQALPYCKLALASDPDGPARDSRGLVYAGMGRYQEAIEDFTVFLAWVDRSAKETCRGSYRPTRLAWINDLEAGRDPFDTETLRQLRVRPIASTDEPC